MADAKRRALHVPEELYAQEASASLGAAELALGRKISS